MQRPSASSRPSSRASYLPVSSSSSSTAGLSSQGKLLEKKKEYEALAALEKASADFRQRLEGLCTQGDIMAGGVETLGDVLANWPNMMKLVNLFLEGNEHNPDGEGGTRPNNLVRLGIEAVDTKPS